MKKGFTLVEMMIVVAVVALLAALAIPNLLRARMQANETSAQASLKIIASAEICYNTANYTYGNLANLSLPEAQPPYIDGTLASGSKSGYNFYIREATDSSFCISAEPKSANHGSQSFCITEDGVIRALFGGGEIASHDTCVGLSTVQ
ncbi:MAG: pili assembly chaperone [Candidatus Omnitrophota bacterium]|nr:MAG: pili assembly chaperone [Candidatus Omnitrophota bacterium]